MKEDTELEKRSGAILVPIILLRHDAVLTMLRIREDQITKAQTENGYRPQRMYSLA